MYRGFNLNLVNNYKRDHAYELTQKLIYENEIQKRIKKFVKGEGIIDGSALQSNWFAQLDAEIFISHSHQDRDIALGLSWWLFDNFKITSFVDSSIWGYADDLLKMIDDEYCLNPDKKDYNYKKRNYSTSHVHSLLSTALMMMIDKTECLFFINTPQSIKIRESIEKTSSPWLYYEIAITQFIRKKSILEYRPENKILKAEQINEKLNIEYEVDLDHLTIMNDVSLNNWLIVNARHPSSYPLDKLYQLNQI
jgi:hypothetical protein